MITAHRWLALLVTVGVLLIVPALASAKAFSNCTAVHEVYPHGIAKNAHVATHANGLTARPSVSASVYAQSGKSDRDRDGVACET